MSATLPRDRAKPPSVGTTFPIQARLTRPDEFKRVFSQPVVSADRCFKVLACRGGGERARLGFAVSRHVDKRAVVRNRLKRVIRESFRRHFAANGPAIDFVVLPRAECATICNEQLFQSLDRHWVRVVARLGHLSKQP